MRVDRRAFLRGSAVLAGAGRLGLLGFGCGGGDGPERFPQGVASGEPEPSSVVIWTRVPGEGRDVPVRWEAASDEGFGHVVASGELMARADRDYTVQTLVDGLAPRTTYWYRFHAEGATSRVGRTRTAPAADDDTPVRFAVASCQDFGGRWYHGWRALVEEEADVDFVLFLGDYIYETIGHLDSDPDEARALSIPDGLVLDDPLKGEKAALTLADYRAIYQQIRRDPDLQRAHARWPFITIWDDHEFANDCWQDHATDFDGRQGDEPSRPRREAATRAFLEHQPLRLRYDAAAGFPLDVSTYRRVRWGRHVDLVLTDQRYYRDDHLIPEGPIDQEVGKFIENSAMGSRTFVIKEAFDAREADAQPTMLGETQRTWLTETVAASDATWKLVGSPLMMAQMVLDLTVFADLPDLLKHRWYFKTDQWDGFRSERAAILGALAGVPNVVVLSGDIHGAYAALLSPSPDDAAVAPTAVEYTVAAISSPTIAEQLEAVIASNDILESFGLGDLVPEFDANLRAASPHIGWADSFRNGYAVVEASGEALAVALVALADVRQAAYQPPVERKRFVTRAGQVEIVPA